MRKIVGIIGFPLEHSLSPAMHNAAFRKLGLDFEYVPFEVSPEDLREALYGLRALRLRGFNVTIPHKETIIPLLDEVTRLARDIGAVNTVVIENGRSVGYNTDGPGFINSLKEDARFEPKGKKAVIIGAGGASRAVATMLAAAGVKTIVFSDMIDHKAKQLAGYIRTQMDIPAISVSPGSRELQESLEESELLVNASPVGMFPRVDESPLSENIRLHAGLTVYDLVYNPRETKLMKAAQAVGAKACSGLGMLVRQGALAFTIFTGEEAPFEVMWQAAQAEL